MYSILHTLRKLLPAVAKVENYHQFRSLYVATQLNGKRLKAATAIAIDICFYIFLQ